MGAREDMYGLFTSVNEINLTDDQDGQRAKEGVHKKNISTSYDLQARMSKKGILWNWGYHDDQVAKEINARIPGFLHYDTDGFSEELYFAALREVPIDLDDYADRFVLEVGCGLGEGLNFLSRVIHARSMIGLDLSEQAVNRANAALSRKGLRYVQGDAENLPFEDGEADVVVNIESAHNYPRLEKFLQEVARVLKPGGYFTHVDLYTTQRHAFLKELQAKDLGLEWVLDRDISSNVRAAIHRRLSPDGSFHKALREQRAGAIQRHMAKRVGPEAVGGSFAGYTDSGSTKLLKRMGVLPSQFMPPVDSYRLYVAKKI
ncbi:methyltransferase domain-containing protein [Streptomyces sp. NPDC028722]|uniref:class I SAM-dependent methyltransferase n=1 Tax=unclassified Streptomyces TaxID=2593676 RepID=UPI0033C5C629